MDLELLKEEKEMMLDGIVEDVVDGLMMESKGIKRPSSRRNQKSSSASSLLIAPAAENENAVGLTNHLDHLEDEEDDEGIGSSEDDHEEEDGLAPSPQPHPSTPTTTTATATTSPTDIKDELKAMQQNLDRQRQDMIQSVRMGMEWLEVEVAAMASSMMSILRSSSSSSLLEQPHEDAAVGMSSINDLLVIGRSITSHLNSTAVAASLLQSSIISLSSSSSSSSSSNSAATTPSIYISHTPASSPSPSPAPSLSPLPHQHNTTSNVSNVETPASTLDRSIHTTGRSFSSGGITLHSTLSHPATTAVRTSWAHSATSSADLHSTDMDPESDDDDEITSDTITPKRQSANTLMGGEKGVSMDTRSLSSSSASRRRRLPHKSAHQNLSVKPSFLSSNSFTPSLRTIATTSSSSSPHYNAASQPPALSTKPLLYTSSTLLKQIDQFLSSLQLQNLSQATSTLSMTQTALTKSTDSILKACLTLSSLRSSFLAATTTTTAPPQETHQEDFEESIQSIRDMMETLEMTVELVEESLQTLTLTSSTTSSVSSPASSTQNSPTGEGEGNPYMAVLKSSPPQANLRRVTRVITPSVIDMKVVGGFSAGGDVDEGKVDRMLRRMRRRVVDDEEDDLVNGGEGDEVGKKSEQVDSPTGSAETPSDVEAFEKGVMEEVFGGMSPAVVATPLLPEPMIEVDGALLETSIPEATAKAMEEETTLSEVPPPPPSVSTTTLQQIDQEDDLSPHIASIRLHAHKISRSLQPLLTPNRQTAQPSPSLLSSHLHQMELSILHITHILTPTYTATSPTHDENLGEEFEDQQPLPSRRLLHVLESWDSLTSSLTCYISRHDQSPSPLTPTTSTPASEPNTIQTLLTDLLDSLHLLITNAQEPANPYPRRISSLTPGLQGNVEREKKPRIIIVPPRVDSIPPPPPGGERKSRIGKGLEMFEGVFEEGVGRRGGKNFGGEVGEVERKGGNLGEVLDWVLEDLTLRPTFFTTQTTLLPDPTPILTHLQHRLATSSIPPVLCPSCAATRNLNPSQCPWLLPSLRTPQFPQSEQKEPLEAFLESYDASWGSEIRIGILSFLKQWLKTDAFKGMEEETETTTLIPPPLQTMPSFSSLHHRETPSPTPNSHRLSLRHSIQSLQSLTDSIPSTTMPATRRRTKKWKIEVADAITRGLRPPAVSSYVLKHRPVTVGMDRTNSIGGRTLIGSERSNRSLRRMVHAGASVHGGVSVRTSVASTLDGGGLAGAVRVEEGNAPEKSSGALEVGSVHGMVVQMGKCYCCGACLCDGNLDVLWKRWMGESGVREGEVGCGVECLRGGLPMWLLVRERRVSEKEVEAVAEVMRGLERDEHSHPLSTKKADAYPAPFASPSTSTSHRHQHAISSTSTHLPLLATPTTPQPPFRRPTPTTLLKMDALTIARHLALIDWEIYQTLRPIQFLDQSYSSNPKRTGTGRWRPMQQQIIKREKEGSTVSSSGSSDSWRSGREREREGVAGLIERFNFVVGLVTTLVVGCSTPKARAGVIELFVNVAKHSLDIRSMNASNAITSALTSASLHRLQKTWDKVSRRSLTSLEHLKELFSPTNNFRSLRRHMQSLPSTDPAVPWIGIHLRDIVIVEEANPKWIQRGPDASTIPTCKCKGSATCPKQNHKDDEVINLKRMKLLSNIIDTALRFQQPLDATAAKPVSAKSGSPTLAQQIKMASVLGVSMSPSSSSPTSPQGYNWPQDPAVRRSLTVTEGLLRSPSRQFAASLAVEPRKQQSTIGRGIRNG
ncbi:Ras protein-specific guanine nucleotide-releasing factor [Phlyctochytrium planicorne]|nr:Ras protein-specific guanine nucleotide-releasing factor [Phlyctochytrium planicorne]